MKDTILNIETNTVGDNLEAYYRDDDEFHIGIEEPWAGCTESGFGARTSIELNKDQAKQLYDLIGAFLNENP